MSIPVTEGQILDGKYVVEKVLGAGGMGVVVRAHHIELDDPVALKFLLPEALKMPEAVARFSREARAATKIKSEHVVRVTDVGHFQSGEPYMVMEFLQGCDLGELVRQRGPLPVEDVAEYLLQACEAIAEAHALGIVHRDLKPANLFLTQRADGSPLVKVLDFGISKLTAGASSGPEFGLTKTSAMMGSPLYMSPEQMASARTVDARTDIWALGAIFYELCSGKPPFEADTLPQLCAMVLQQEPEPLRAKRPELPKSAEQLVVRALKKAPSERFANVAELAYALLELAPKRGRMSAERVSRIIQSAGLSASALALPPSSAEEQAFLLEKKAAQAAASTAVSWGKTKPGAAGRSSLAWMAGGAAALVAVVIGGLVLRSALVRGPGGESGVASASENVADPALAPAPARPPPEPALPQQTATAAAPSPSSSARAGAVGPTAPRTAGHEKSKPERPPSPVAAAPVKPKEVASASHPPPPSPSPPSPSTAPAKTLPSLGGRN